MIFTFDARFRVLSCVCLFLTSTMVNQELSLFIARDYVSEPLEMALSGSRKYRHPLAVVFGHPLVSEVPICHPLQLSQALEDFGTPSSGCSPTFLPLPWYLL